MVFCYDPSWRTAHCLINVRTWAIFFPRHLANMSSMVPLWASTHSGFLPNLGPRVRSHAVRGRLFIVLIIAAHISPNVFSLQNFLSNIHVLFLAYIHRPSYLSYITFNNIYILLLRDNHSVTSSILPGRPTALSLLCLIPLVCRKSSPSGTLRYSLFLYF